MNWTSSFLLQSDKLAIVPHLPLAPASTVVHGFGHRPESESAKGVAMLSAES